MFSCMYECMYESMYERMYIYIYILYPNMNLTAHYLLNSGNNKACSFNYLPSGSSGTFLGNLTGL